MSPDAHSAVSDDVLLARYVGAMQLPRVISLHACCRGCMVTPCGF